MQRHLQANFEWLPASVFHFFSALVRPPLSEFAIISVPPPKKKRKSATDHRWPVSCKWGAAQSLRHSHRPFWLMTKCHLGKSGSKKNKFNPRSKCAGTMQNQTVVISLLILTVFVAHSCWLLSMSAAEYVYDLLQLWNRRFHLQLPSFAVVARS